mgnify:CR=1 FL=1
MSSRKRITGRTGFDRQTKTRIDRRRREGATFAQIADELGMSSSSFYSIRKNQRRMGTRLQKQLIEASNFDLTGPSSSDTIGRYNENIGGRKQSSGVNVLRTVNMGGSGNRTTFSAADTLEDLIANRSLYQQSIEDGWGEMDSQEHRVPIEGGYMTVNLDSLPTQEEYLEGQEFERPTITKRVTVIGEDGIAREVEISYKFGRGKSDEQRERIENQLREQGIDPSEFDSFYDDATGYSS